jgi:phage baseplate assembly protein W
MTTPRWDPSKAFLGVGWAFPPSPAPPQGDVDLVAYEEDVRQAVLLILQTDRGERVMRPDFGAGLRSLVFEPINTTTMALVKHQVEEALITWEPRIDVEDVTVTAHAVLRNTLNIEIRYRVRAVNSFYNLVFPFFLQEGQP